MTATAGPTARSAGWRGVLAAVLVAGSTALTGCGATAVPAAPPSASASRDPSGLLVVPPEDYSIPGEPIPAALDPAFTVASRLSYENPADFGIAAVEGDQVVLPVASELSEPIATATDRDARAAALLAYDREVRASFPPHPSPPDLLGKRLKLTPERLRLFADQVRVTEGTVSRRDLQQLQERAVDLAVRPVFDARFSSCGYDPEVGRVVLTVERLTPELAAALVEEFGTDAVAVQIAPRPLTGTH